MKSLLFIFLLTLVSSAFLDFTHLTIDYNEPEQEFRAVWVSPWGGDEELVSFKDKDDFIKNMNYILDTIKMYHMNGIIYHIRTHNDALYNSRLNPKSHYWSKANFDEFDPLKWMITETHKRGIEFHAWMNPYRVKSDTETSLEEIAKQYADFKSNPASVAANMLKGTNTVILNPGLENVRNFIADTVSEVMMNYEIDAIHFDDYFYIDMGAGGAIEGEKTILDEPDQKTYEDYIDTHTTSFSKTSAPDKADWRRLMVDTLIELLHNTINQFNAKNDKYIELGISPTGIWRNGDGEVTYDEQGNAISTGSKTGGQEHYHSYLFCDSLKWVNNEWINYILPQSYWAMDHPVAAYKEVMGWWNKVVKNKKVNLYSGIGLYMANRPESYKAYGWQNDMNELLNQLTYVADMDRIDGVSIYNFQALKAARDGLDVKSAKQVNNALTSEAWQNMSPPAEKRSFTKVELPMIEGTIEGNVITFKKLKGAKFYVVYRSKDFIRYVAFQIVDTFASDEDTIEWKNPEPGQWMFGLKALSYTNTLGDGI